MSLGYTSSLDYIYDEIERIYLLVRAQIARWRISERNLDFKGLVITEQEVDLLLSEDGGERWIDNSGYRLQQKERALLQNRKERIAQKKEESLLKGQQLRLCSLSSLFHLNPIETDILLIALAPEVDRRFERLYAYLHDDVTKKRPSVDLCQRLLCDNAFEKRQVRMLFKNGVLVTQGLIDLIEDPSHNMPTLLNNQLKIRENIVDYLLEVDSDRSHNTSAIKRVVPNATLENLLLPNELKTRLLGMVEKFKQDGERLTLYFHGNRGCGKKATAEALCRVLGVGLLLVDAQQLLDWESEKKEKALYFIYHESILNKTAVLWRVRDLTATENQLPWDEPPIDMLREYPQITFISSSSSDLFYHQDRFSSSILVEFPKPDCMGRRRMWDLQLEKSSSAIADDVNLDAVAAKFKMSGGQIKQAVVTAENLAIWRDPNDCRICQADLYTACRARSSPNLSTLARKVTPHYTWNDIVLPYEQMGQLKEIYNTVRYRPLVYETWGFDAKLSLGRGTNILFTGPPGTGKTMAADVMANELNLDLYKVDLSNVVSKYIGETEKNLSRIFYEAGTSDAILFFDEADALFGKRSEVRDAHDRYANIETGYLLQKMEEYDGVTILSTNLRKNMDEAFVRRMAFLVRFPMPKVDSRLRIWERIWPQALPRRVDIDLPFIAEQFELSGGNIKNIALAAAFLAASDGKIVSMNHLICAIQRELRKKGKTVVEKSFGPYAGIASNASEDEDCAVRSANSEAREKQ
jgi:SpoVK/Ycf46/Vps4 family AAA+-type ATPase